MRNEEYPDVLEIWGVTWTKRGDGWEGPAITDPEDGMLALAVEYQRIIRRDGRYMMVDPSITLDRFSWDDDDELEISPCLSCVHKHTTGATCTAFPTGIPDDILLTRHDHRTRYKGDHGIRYQAVADEEEA
jgi:hypothetical protein